MPFFHISEVALRIIVAAVGLLVAQPAHARDTFFPLVSMDAKSVAGCRMQALWFDTNRRIEQAAKVVKACDREADRAKGGCLQYAVAVSMQAQKWISMMQSIERGGPYNPMLMKYARAHVASKLQGCRA